MFDETRCNGSTGESQCGCHALRFHFGTVLIASQTHTVSRAELTFVGKRMRRMKHPAALSLVEAYTDNGSIVNQYSSLCLVHATGGRDSGYSALVALEYFSSLGSSSSLLGFRRVSKMLMSRSHVPAAGLIPYFSSLDILSKANSLLSFQSFNHNVGFRIIIHVVRGPIAFPSETSAHPLAVVY